MKRLRQNEALAELGPVLARAAAIIAVLVVTVVALVIVTRPYGDYEINAVFDDSRGLIEGGDVTAGFQEVGSVEEIKLGEDGLPRVKMRVSGDFKLHQGAYADIRLSSNVGAINRVVELSQGDPDAPELEDGDTLGPSFTDQPVDLDAAVSTLDPETRADAAAVLAGLDDATKGRGGDLDKTLRHSSTALNETANALAQVTADGAALSSLVADTDTVLSALAHSPGDLSATAERTATLLGVAGARQEELRRTADAIGPALSAGRQALVSLDEAIPELRGLVVEAEPLVDRLRPVAKRLPDLIREARTTVGFAGELVRAGPKRLAKLTPLLRDAIPLVAELDPLVSQLNPALDYLRAFAPETVGFFQLTADLLANYDVNGHMTRFSPLFIPVAKHPNIIAPDSTAAGSLARPFNRPPGSLEGEPWNDFAGSFIGGGEPWEPVSPTMAKISAVASVVLVALTALILWVTSYPPTPRTVEAEFQDAFPILAGMNVRVNGAVAGSVREVEVSDQGTAKVTMNLNEGTGEPRADASAAIRQQDITGDSYLSLSLGESPDELDSEGIPVDRTLVAPRFDDLLNSFAEPERQALRLVLVEAGKALESRGDDINKAALSLRPALEATNDAVGELATQNQALGQLVTNAEQVTAQTASRSGELAGMIDSLATVLSTTADHGDALDATLAGAPATARQAKETLTRLRRTAVAATPLAQAVGASAPSLARGLKLAPGFVADARKALRTLGPTINLGSAFLRDGGPTLQASPKRALTAPLELAASVDDLLRVLLGNEPVLKTLFGADDYGEGPGRFNDVGLGAFAVEGGTQTGYPGNDPERRFLRAVLVPSCELFGFPVAPNCLVDAINAMSAAPRRAKAQGPDPFGPSAAPAPGAQPETPPLTPKVPGLPKLPPVQVPGQNGGGVSDLLDFLLGP